MIEADTQEAVVPKVIAAVQAAMDRGAPVVRMLGVLLRGRNPQGAMTKLPLKPRPHATSSFLEVGV